MSSGSGDPPEGGITESPDRLDESLLRAAPDPIFVAEVSTGTIVETNEAAARLLDTAREEIVGWHQSDLHPEDRRDQYQDLFAEHVEEQGTRRTLPNGSQIHVRTATGNRIPVEINATTVETPERNLIVGIFRDISDRLASQQAIQEQKQRYESFFENNPMNIWEEDLSELKAHLDALGATVDSLETYFTDNPAAIKEALRKIDVIDVNQNAVEYYDADSKAHLMENIGALFTDEAYTKFIDMLVAIAEGETAVEIETRSRSLSGTERSEIIELYVPEPFEEEYRRAYLITNDITDRKAREREHRSFKQAVENTGHSVVITDESGEIEYVNPTFEDVTGYTQEEVMGRNPRLLKSGEHEADFYERMWETILDGEVWSAELINERKDGSHFVVDQTIAPILEDGEIQRFVAVNQDITDRKERERELLNLQKAVEHAGHSIYICDGTGTIEYVNEEFESLTGYSADEAVGKTPELFRAADRESAPTGRWKPVLDGEEWTGEMVLTAKSGERFVVDEALAPIEDASGLIRGFVGVQIDVTERKLREQQLAVFARVLRHNLRNDGTTIKGRAQLLERTVTDEAATEHIQKIKRNIDSLLEIGEKAHHVQNTLSQSLGTDGDRELESMLSTIEEVIATAYPEAEVSVTATLDESVRVDPRMVPAIQELVRNGIEHSDAAVPKVSIRAERADGTGVIRIEDNGPGIPEEERRAIEAGTEDPLDHGSGLGLWLAYWLTTFLGGEIDISTEGPGTTVTLRVPVWEA
jgi:PAS domain S-box-containing protein